MKIAILGVGAYAIALARVFNKNKDNEVMMWAKFKEEASVVIKKRENPSVLPGVKIPDNIKITMNLGACMEGASIVILAVPAVIEKFNQQIEKGIKETGKEKTIKTIKTIANGFSKIGIDIRRKVFAKIQENFGGNLKYLFCGAAPLDPELITKMEGYGFKFLQGYGLTETSPLVSGTSL